MRLWPRSEPVATWFSGYGVSAGLIVAVSLLSCEWLRWPTLTVVDKLKPLSQPAGEMASSSNEVRTRAGELARLAEKLKEVVGGFKL